jgi:hypothetical protein
LKIMNTKFVLICLCIFHTACAQQPFCQCPCSGNAYCQVQNQLFRVDQIQFGAPVRTVSWLCNFSSCSDVTAPLAAIGGQPVSTTSNTYDFRIYQLTSADKLSWLVDGVHGGYVLTSAWCCIGGIPYIAVAGVANSDGNEVEIYRVDPVAETLTLAAYYSHGGNVNSIAWLCDCGTTTTGYLAIGGEASSRDGADVRVLAVPGFSLTTTVALVSTSDKVHGATVYSVDWCTQLSCPLLAIGGKVSSIECGINVRIYSLNCTTGQLYPYADTVFGSDLVNTVRWCCGQNSCFLNPLLAVGGSRATDSTNIRTYYLSSRTNALVEYANTASNPQPDIFTIAWNPSCQCSDITAGGGCLSEPVTGCSPNIFVYNIPSSGTLPRTLNLVASQQFDTNVTSLAWCQPTGVTCSYLLVGTEVDETTNVNIDCNNETSFTVALYRGLFCQQQSSSNVLPICSRS